MAVALRQSTLGVTNIERPSWVVLGLSKRSTPAISASRAAADIARKHGWTDNFSYRASCALDRNRLQAIRASTSRTAGQHERFFLPDQQHGARSDLRDAN